MFNRHKVALYEQDAFDQRSGSREEMMLSAGGKKRLEVRGSGWELNLTLPEDVSCWRSSQGFVVSVNTPGEKAKKVTAILEYVVACVRQSKVDNPETKEQWLTLVEKRIECWLGGLGGVKFTYRGDKTLTGVLKEKPFVINFKANLPAGLCVKKITGYDKKSLVLVEFEMNSGKCYSSSRFDLGKAEIEGLIGKTVDGWVYVRSMLKKMATTRDQWYAKANDSARRSFWEGTRNYVEKSVDLVTIQEIRALADKHLTVTVGSAAGADGVGVGASACKGSKVESPVIVAGGVTPVATLMTGARAGAGSESLGKMADVDEKTTKKRRVTAPKIAEIRGSIGAARPSPDDVTVLEQAKSPCRFAKNPAADVLKLSGVGLGDGAGVPIKTSGSPFFSDNVVTVTPIWSAVASVDPSHGNGLSILPDSEELKP